MRILIIYKVLILLFIYHALSPQKIERQRFCKPLKEIKINESFGKSRKTGMHTGIDLEAPRGTNVYASLNGKMYYQKNHPRYGNFVVIESSPYRVLYAHLSKIETTKEDILCGEKIGEVGSSGYSTGPHLHLETSANNVFLEPHLFF